MMKRSERLRTTACAAALLCAAVVIASGRSGLPASGPPPLKVATSAAIECEGDACAQVTFTYDEAKGEYRAQNGSADRWVKVSASNLAAAAAVCLAPGKTDALALKSVVGPIHADLAEPRCGAPPA